MRLQFAMIFLALVTPTVCLGQQRNIDDLLPANSQMYLHWDGFEAHKKAASNLAVVKMWNGDTGKFAKALWKYLQEQSKPFLAKEFNAELADAVFDEFSGLLTSVTSNGFALGVELQSVMPFKGQATFAFPNGAGPAKSPLSFLNTMSKLSKEIKVETAKQGNRTVQYVHADPIYISWWSEGRDAVWSIGTTEPTELLKGLDGKDKLTGQALYKQVQEFKEFPVWFRGYIDMPALSKIAGQVHPAVNQFTDVLGLDSIKSLTFFSGFDGPAERAVTFTNLEQGPRKGLFKVMGSKTFSLNDLPPMPADAGAFAAGSVNIPAAYDLGIDALETMLKTFAPPGAPQNIKQMIKDFEQNNNISISGVLNSLDELYVTYAVSAEGPLGLGQTQLIKVKDAKKLEDELGKIFKLAENQTGGLLSLKKSNYHGGTIYTLHISNPNGVSIQSINYTIHKGWLALAQYPQPLMGYILRANKELPSWKASLELQAKLAQFPKQFTNIAVSDPRPVVKLVLSILPPAISLTETYVQQLVPGVIPGKNFDLTLIPNAYEATKELFPNITISTNTPNGIRSETRASLALGF